MSKQEIENIFNELGIEYKYNGYNFWLEHKSFEHADKLIAAGCIWSGKKNAWYRPFKEQ